MARERQVVLAVDLGGTRVRAALVDRQGQLLGREVLPLDPRAGPQGMMERLVAVLRRLLGSFPRGVLRGIGLSLAGPLDPRTGTLHHPPNLPGWDGFSPKAYLAERFPVPVQADNDANLAALGEHRYGIGRGFGDLVFIIWGTGIGGGLVLGGRVHQGARGFAGELGHLVLEPQGPPCSCGGRGCLEALASGPAMARRARELLEAGASSLLPPLVEGRLERLTAEVLAQAERQGDLLARQVVQEAAAYLGMGIASVRHLLDPQLIVVGGGVTGLFHTAFPTLHRTARRYAIAPEKGQVPVVPSVLGDNAGLLGAAALMWGALEPGA